MGCVERRKKRKMKKEVCWCVWVGNWCVGVRGLVTGVLVRVVWQLVCWCAWVGNWCVGACGLVTGVLVRAGW